MSMPMSNAIPLRDPEDTAIPQFFNQEVQNTRRTEEEGRPIFDMKPFVRITIPGDQYHIPVFAVNDQHKARWPAQWSAFQESGDEEYVEGTPLTEWPLLSRAQVAELRAINVPTVEALSTLGDKYLKMGLRELRDKARAFLEASTGASAVGEKLSALEKQLSDRDDLILDMKETIDLLSNEVKALRPQEKPKRRKKED